MRVSGGYGGFWWWGLWWLWYGLRVFDGWLGFCGGFGMGAGFLVGGYDLWWLRYGC